MTFIKYYIYNFSDCIGKILFKVLFFYSNLYQCFLISIHFFLVCKLASILSFTKSQFAFTFFPMSITGIFRKSFLFGLQKERGKTEKQCRGSFNTLLWKANPCSYLQHVYQRSCSFCYNVLNFYYIFENLIEIIILLDILLSLIGALSKYLFLSCFKSLGILFLSFSIIATTFYNIFYNNNFTRSKCCFDNINIYINTSVRSLSLTVFIFDQKETFSISSTPSSSITSYNLVIFYFIGAILSSILYKKDNFNITKQLFPLLVYFFLCFSANSLHKLKNCDLKYCPNNEFFSTELIKITGDINSAEMLMSSRYFALNKLRIKCNVSNFITFLYYYLVM